MKANTKSLLFALGAAAAVWLIRKASGVAGVGKVERIKRRIYKEVSLAQKAGVDFSKKFDELDEHDIVALETVGADVGWKQSKRSIESGKSYAQAYYNSLRRAWNAVSGVRGIGTAYNVKDANGRVVLTWIEDAEAHYNAERDLNELEAKLRKQRNAARRRQQRIDREGLPAVVPTPAPVPEPEPIPEPAPVAPKRERKPRVDKSQEREERALFAEKVLNYLAGSEKRYDEIINFQNKYDGKAWGDMLKEAFADGSLKVRGNGYRGKYVYLKAYKSQSDKKDGWFTFLQNEFVHVAEFLLEQWRQLKEENTKMLLQTSKADLARSELLNKAQHMQVMVRDENGEWNLYSGDERWEHLQQINWIVMVHISPTNRNVPDPRDLDTIYPIRSFNKKDDAELFAKQRTDKDNHITAKVVAVTDVNIDAISGLHDCDM